MIFYAIHNKEYWDKFKNKEFLESDTKYYLFEKEYKWLQKQMRKRIKYEDDNLLWVWVSKPDLRCSGHLQRGTKGVLLEIELPIEDVLISDFMSWHCVLNDFPIELYDNENIDKEKSWERIFDIELMKTLKDYTNCDKLQGTTGKIPIKNIKVIKEFIAK